MALDKDKYHLPMQTANDVFQKKLTLSLCECEIWLWIKSTRNY